MWTWTLNPLAAFEAGSHGEKQWSIDFARAYGTSEMAIVGDRFIGTPAPLRFRVNVDPEKSDPMPPSEGRMRVTIASVQLLSRDRPLSGRAAAIASKLLWHGNWVDAGQQVERDGSRMLWIDHLFGPTEDEEDWGEGCAMIGSLGWASTSSSSRTSSASTAARAAFPSPSSPTSIGGTERSSTSTTRRPSGRARAHRRPLSSRSGKR